MSIEADLVAAIEADTDIGGLVGDRIYLVEAPQQDLALPYICYEVVASVPVESPAAAQEINETVVDVASYATTHTEAKTLADAVRDVLIEQLDAAVIENTQDQRDRDTRRAVVIQSYRIWHVEAFP